MIKEVIQVLSTDQKQGAKGPYLEVSYRDEKGQERKKNIFDQTLWNLFGEGLWVEWELEKEGNWWNVKSAQRVKEGVEKIKEALTTEVAPQEKGMFFKELGECIRCGQLEKDFPKSFVRIKSDYYKAMSRGTGIDLWSKEKED